MEIEVIWCNTGADRKKKKKILVNNQEPDNNHSRPG